MKHINKQVYIALLKRCQSGKHKLRENEFGVVWCVHCGLLSTSVNSNTTKLSDDNKIQIHS